MQGNCIDSLHDSITVCPPVGTHQYIAKVHAKLCGGPWIWMSDTIAITRTDSLYITQIQVQHVSCYGAGDGKAQAILHGGLPPYTYTLNGNVVNNLHGLAPGTYTLVVSDKGGCKDSTVFVITEPNPLSVDVNNVIHETCFDAHDAVVAVMAQGGTAPYTFAINNGNWQSDSIFSQLAAGTYTISVKDIYNCTASTIVIIYGALAPLSVYKDIVPNTCKTNFDASIQLNISGGTAPYFVLWHTNPPRNGNYIANLQNGSYPFTITDSRNCTLIDSVILHEAKTCAFYEPNAFTPNGDGINDVFRLSEYCGGIIAYEMKIFNRWGNHIFTSRDITIGWDGKINGKEQSSDIYYYTVSYTCNENNNGTHHRMNGAFYLVR